MVFVCFILSYQKEQGDLLVMGDTEIRKPSLQKANWYLNKVVTSIYFKILEIGQRPTNKQKQNF